MMAIALTPKQREIARHALGLPNSRRTSYRNYFRTGVGSPTHHMWNEMVELGAAFVHRAVETSGGNDFFYLTFIGAESALNPGEKLDPEDFPEPRP